MDVIFLHGPPAAGKHTVGEKLSERLGIPLFHNHLTVDLAKSLFEFGTPGFVFLREQIWLASFRSAARAGRSFVFTFNPEATVDPGLIGRLEAIVSAAGGRVWYVELRCAEEEIERRIGNASRTRFGKLTDLETYRSLRAAGAFAFPPLPASVVGIDTDSTSADEAAGAIGRAIGPAIP